MSRARKRKFTRRKKAPFVGRFFRRRLGVEQICDECSKPYLSKPLAKPIEQFVHGSAVASVFVEQQFGKERFHVQFGRFAANGQEMFISQFLGFEHLEDIAEVASMARRFIREQRPLRLVSRR
jgi:hypothetical protein